MPILEHQVEALVAVGVTKVVLAVSYKADDVMEFIKNMEAKYKIKMVCSLEETPMGTGEHQLHMRVLTCCDGRACNPAFSPPLVPSPSYSRPARARGCAPRRRVRRAIFRLQL